MCSNHPGIKLEPALLSKTFIHELIAINLACADECRRLYFLKFIGETFSG